MPITVRSILAFALICVTLIVMLFFVTTLIEGQLYGPNSGIWLYWLQVLSGNWTGAKGVLSPWGFAFASLLAVLLNNAVIIVVPAFIWGIITERRGEMVRLKQALVLRDAMSKTALFSKLGLANDPETVKKIDAAFQEVNETWFNYVSEVLPEVDPGQLHAKLQEPID